MALEGAARMLKSVIEPLLDQVGRRTTRTPPTVVELVLAHAAYLSGFALLGWAVLRATGHRNPVGFEAVLSLAGLAAALSYLFLLHAGRFRPALPELWFASHLVWIFKTYTGLALAGAVGVLLLAVGLLLAALATPIAAMVVYGPLLGVVAFLLWFFYRCARGYVALLRHAPVG